MILSFYKYQLILIAIIIALASSCMNDKPEAESVKEGILDISQTSFNEKGYVKLKGEWEYFADGRYPNKFDTGSDFIQVPTYLGADSNFADNTTAVFRMRLINIKGFQRFVFEETRLAPKTRIYADGILAAEAGKSIGDRGENNRFSGRYEFYTDTDTLEIAIETGGYKKGAFRGIKVSPVLYDAAVLNKQRHIETFSTTLIVTSMFLMAMYYIGLYFLRKSEKSTLAFALFILSITSYIFVLSDLFDFFFDAISLVLTKRLWMLSFVVSVPLFLVYINQLYPDENSKKSSIPSILSV